MAARAQSARPDIGERRLYLITDARSGLAALLERAIAGGADVVQIREKTLPDGLLLGRLEEAREVTRRHDVPLVVNDRPDLAALVDADYVHVGQDDLPVPRARQLLDRVGQSTHTRRQIETSSADYIGVGPIYATPTKEGRAPVGLSLVADAVEVARRPWFAIGGIGLDTIDDVVGAGATRIAVVRAVADAADPEAAARALRKRLG
ncbi:MAG: thiamine phosphate synthase [Gaiellaceae bacterium]